MVNVNINAQQWLDEKYPKNGVCERSGDKENKGKTRKGITLLDIRKGKVGNGIFSRNKNLVEDLKLEGFTNLCKLIISSHQLISLDISDCSNLEELDCHGNELTTLRVDGCSNLKKIDCSNNPLRELDLVTCPSLEEVNINNCLKLTEETIKANLTYDTEKGKLSKGSAKNSPQIRKAEDNDIRNILIVGITGNGKSALANALANTDQFEEKDSSVGVTKYFQKSQLFQWEGKKYHIIDNVGFGDTANTAIEDILFRVGEGIYSAKEGINQVLFVYKGRFSKDQVEAFKMFREFIDESGITRFTTIIRTNFVNFKSKEKSQEDEELFLSESEELAEIINSCNDIIHVNNPAIPVIKEGDDEETIEDKKEEMLENKKKREWSRKMVLTHLAENCPEIYKLREWDSIHAQVSKYIKNIEEKEKSLAKATTNLEREKLASEIKENKEKVAEEVNAKLVAEFSANPKLTAEIEIKKINIAWFSKLFK